MKFKVLIMSEETLKKYYVITNVAKNTAPRGYIAVVSFNNRIKSSLEFKFESDTICIIVFLYRDISKLNLYH